MTRARNDGPGSPWRFRLLAGVAILSLLVPRMTQRGMFLDGITYAVVARNMAIGVGTFWQPSYTATVYPEFYEQLPLAMGAQSLAFRAFGDHLFVERGYSVVVFLLHALVVAGIWRLLLPRRYDSLPLIFWVLPSVVTWSVINNTLENTQALFTSVAVLCLVLGTRGDRTLKVASFGVLAGLAVIAAVLAKGPVGFFPLAVPPLLFLIQRDVRPALIAVLWAALIATVGVAAIAVLGSGQPAHAVSEWARSHLMPALQGERGPGWSAFDLWRHLTMGICGRLLVLTALIWAVRWKHAGRFVFHPAAVFFLLVGLLASVPVLISRVLAGMYFMPAVPFFALAFAALALPAVQSEAPAQPTRWRHVPVLIAVALVLTSAVVIATRGSLERRDVDLLRELDGIAAVLPRAATVGGCSSAAQDWSMHAYLQRLFRVSMETRDRPVGGWFLVYGDACAVPSGCELAAAGGPLQLHRCTAQ